MKDSTVERVLAAADEMYSVLGASSFEDGIDRICVALEELLANFGQLRTRESAREALRALPEPTTLEAATLVGFIRSFPYVIRKALPTAVKEGLKNIPHDPGGRPKLLDDAASRAVCEEIGLLFGKGVPLGAAFARVARKHNASVRTIERAWSERRKFSSESESEEN